VAEERLARPKVGVSASLPTFRTEARRKFRVSDIEEP
jgi:hypothetical protein